jgi:hypothetical protein
LTKPKNTSKNSSNIGKNRDTLDGKISKTFKKDKTIPFIKLIRLGRITDLPAQNFSPQGR